MSSYAAAGFLIVFVITCYSIYKDSIGEKPFLIKLWVVVIGLLGFYATASFGQGIETSPYLDLGRGIGIALWVAIPYMFWRMRKEISSSPRKR
ncbi:MAG: hypothetical protein ACLFVI_01405 [Archaeoglobaceae archaeon]